MLAPKFWVQLDCKLEADFREFITGEQIRSCVADTNV